MNKEEIINSWKKFTEKNDFQLNPDEKHVQMIAEGVLKNEKEHGLKFCPCRLRDGTREMDMELICPCNFKTHSTWTSKGMCWCGLFVKK